MNNMKNTSQSKNRKGNIGLLLGLGLSMAIVISGLSSCGPKGNTKDKETAAYEACSSVSDYRGYINTYGTTGKYYKEAKNVVDRYVADSIDKAKTRDRKLQREEAEEECYKLCTTIEGCDNYLNRYPQGEYVEQVKAKKAELEKALGQEELMFAKCSTIEACAAYLKEYPKGKYVDQVKAKKAELEAVVEKAKKQEDDMYKKCTTIEGCAAYLKTYPQGRYVTEVLKKKAELEKKELENSGKTKNINNNKKKVGIKN